MSATADSPSDTIVFVTASLGAGGAERVLVWLANRFARAGLRTAIIRLESARKPSFYPVAPGIDVISLDSQGYSKSLVTALRANFARIAALRAAVARYPNAAIVGFGTETNILTVLATGPNRRVFVAERCDPTHYPAHRLWRVLRALTYPRATAVIFQTHMARTALSASLPGVVIPNPVPPPPAPSAGDPHIEAVEIAAMGRLTPQKGFDVLIEAVARLPDRHAMARLRILGEGEDRAALTAQARALGLADRVAMPGVVATPAPFLRAARVFALPSRYEGYPNALCEAMALGLPVVAADCPSGPREILRDGADGLLVPPGDPDALAAALTRLLDDPGLRATLGARAATIVDRLSEDAVFAAWRNVLAPSARSRAD